MSSGSKNLELKSQFLLKICQESQKFLQTMRALGWKYQGFETMDSTVFVNALPYGQIIQVSLLRRKDLKLDQGQQQVQMYTLKVIKRRPQSIPGVDSFYNVYM